VAAARKKAKAGAVHGVAKAGAVHGRPPRLPETLVPRERLYAAIDTATDAPLTQLIAPAGTGKTILLSAWASRQIDAGDTVSWVAAHDHEQLTARLCGAVGRRTGQILTVLSGAQRRGVEPHVVIVDDAHLLPRKQLQVLAEVLDSTPDGVRLILASRRDLPLPVLDLELADRASTLRINDLRFTNDEAANLVSAHAEHASGDDIARLVERTAGWAAALVLAARALAENAEPGVVSPALVATDQPVLDHLLGEAFTMLSGPAQEVLLSTYSEPLISAGRAAILSGNPDAGDLLADLTSRGLLVTAYQAADEVTYRYHPLLVELLRRRVVSNPDDADKVRRAHLRSAAHAEAARQHQAALSSAVDARDSDLVARLLLDYGPELLSAGDVSTVRAALDALTGNFITEHPYLLGIQGLQRRSSGDVSGAVMVGARAARVAMAYDERARESTDLVHALQADTMMLRLWQSRYGWQDADAAIADAHDLLGCTSGAEAHGHRTRYQLSPARWSWLLIELAAAETWIGDLTSASTHLGEALVSARAAGHDGLVTAGLAHRAVLELARGDTRSAASTAERVIQHDGIEPISEDYAARAHVVLGLAAYSRLDVDAARKWQEQVEGSDVSRTDSVVAALRALLNTCLLIEEGELDLARLALAANPTAAGPLPAFLVRDLCLARYHCATLVGDAPTARQQVDNLRTVGLTAEADLLDAKLTARGADAASGARVLEQALTAAGDAYAPIVAWAEALRVAKLLATDNHDEARTALLAVINRITPQQMVRALTPAADDPAFLALVEAAADDPAAHPYVRVVADALAGHQARWLAVRGAMPLDAGRGADTPLPRPRAARSAARLSVPAHPERYGVLDGIPIKLTARESDVLGQLALGSSYTEIAKDLYITENTVKTHLASLYRKLGVDKRSAALRVAREVGLLV
jgi:ATP/maltotriose-dependent transcriptional regulator MalT